MGTVGSIIAHIYHIKRAEEKAARESIFEPRGEEKTKIKKGKILPSSGEGFEEPLLNKSEE